MASSHPMYLEPRMRLREGPMKEVEYLLVSPVHDPGQLCSCCLQYEPYKAYQKQPARSASAGVERPPECPVPFHRSHSQPAQTVRLRNSAQYQCMYVDGSQRPLKSCLVKRRQDRKLLALKHRSWSDPSDAVVLKHSHEGQIIYQLVTHPPEGGSCGFKASAPAPGSPVKPQPRPQSREVQDTSPPTKEVIQDMEEKVVKKLATGPLEPTCCQAQPPTQSSPCKANATAPAQAAPNPMATSTPPNSPEQIPVPSCTCGTTHAVLHSSDESPVAPNQDICKTKKSVSFSEEISYHSPGTSPHMSPRKAVLLQGEDGEQGELQSGLRRVPVGRGLMMKKPRPLSFPGGQSASSESLVWMCIHELHGWKGKTNAKYQTLCTREATQFVYSGVVQSL